MGLTFLSVIAYHLPMYSVLFRFAAILVLATSLCVLSGAATSVLAVAQNLAHAGDCCPSEHPDDQSEDDCCVSPECQCLSCLTIDLQEASLTLRGTSGIVCARHEITATLTGGNYRSIDYPPEVA
jgi:hypothetical protein